MKILKLTEGKKFDMGPGDTRRVIGPDTGAKNITLNYAVFQPGDAFTQHIHKNSEDVFVVLKGKGIVKLDAQEFPIQEGDVVHVSPGEFHGTVNTGDGEMIIISCQAPPDLELYRGAGGRGKNL